MKWLTRLQEKNFSDTPNDEVSKVSKGVKLTEKGALDTLDTSSPGDNQKKFLSDPASISLPKPRTEPAPGLTRCADCQRFTPTTKDDLGFTDGRCALPWHVMCVGEIYACCSDFQAKAGGES